MDRELMMLEDLRILAAEVNDIIFSLRDKFNPTLLKDELEGLISRRVLSLEIEKIGEASSEGKTLYEIRFKNLRHRLHVPKQELSTEEYQRLVKRFHEEFFNSKVAGRFFLLDVPGRWLFLLEENGGNLLRGYCEVVRFTTDLQEEYERCKNCLQSKLGRKPSVEWETVLKSVDEDQPLEPFVEDCMVPCELIDLVAEVEALFDLTIDTELKKAYRKLFGS